MARYPQWKTPFQFSMIPFQLKKQVSVVKNKALWI